MRRRRVRRRGSRMVQIPRAGLCRIAGPSSPGRPGVVRSRPRRRMATADRILYAAPVAMEARDTGNPVWEGFDSPRAAAGCAAARRVVLCPSAGGDDASPSLRPSQRKPFTLVGARLYGGFVAMTPSHDSRPPSGLGHHGTAGQEVMCGKMAAGAHKNIDAPNRIHRETDSHAIPAAAPRRLTAFRQPRLKTSVPETSRAGSSLVRDRPPELPEIPGEADLRRLSPWRMAPTPLDRDQPPTSNSIRQSDGGSDAEPTLRYLCGTVDLQRHS